MKDSIAQVVLKLLKDELNYKFKTFRTGDPGLIPPANLPAVFVSEVQTNYTDGPTLHDEIEHVLLIQLVFDKKEDFGNPDESHTLENRIERIVQGREDSTGNFLDGTLIKVLRENYTLGNLVIENINQVRRGVNPRSEELITEEAHIDVTVREIQAVTARA